MIWLKVTTEEIYAFEPKYSNNWDTKTIIDEWFHRYPIDRSHAGRDGAKVGNSKRLVSVVVISEPDLAKYIEKGR